MKCKVKCIKKQEIEGYVILEFSVIRPQNPKDMLTFSNIVSGNFSLQIQVPLLINYEVGKEYIVTYA